MKRSVILLIGTPTPFTNFIETIFQTFYEIEARQDFLLTDFEPASPVKFALIHHLPPTADAFEQLKKLGRKNVKFPVVVSATQPSPEWVQRVFRLGANDVLLASSDREAVLECFYRNIHHSFSKPSPLKTLADWFVNWVGLQGSRSEAAVLGLMPRPFAAPAAESAVNQAVPDVQATLFGNFSLRIKGKTVPELPVGKTLELLTYLLVHHEKPIHRDTLMAKFWPNVGEECAKNSLNQVIHKLRRFFQPLLPGSEAIVFKHGCYSFSPDLSVQTDTGFFQKCSGSLADFSSGKSAAARKDMSALHQSLDVYRGEFLENFRLEEWMEDLRNHFREKYLQAMGQMSDFFFKNGDVYLTINLCNRMLEKDPTLESTHRRLMECYLSIGERQLALNQYKKCRKALTEEYDIEPSKETEVLFKKLRERDFAPPVVERVRLEAMAA